MSFDVRKVIRSPGCDHGHDEESQNGREVKIDILEDGIRTPEWFQSASGIFWSTGELREFARRSVGPYWAIRERERGCLGQPPPPRPSPNWTRGRGCAPSLFPTPTTWKDS